MKQPPIQHLEILRNQKRNAHHPLQHQLHRDFRMSKKTLFYIKEYGPHTHVASRIIKESIKILLFASLVSSFGGLALEHIKHLFVSIVPLTILLPTLNDMVGDYGTVISSRVSTLLHEGKVQVGEFYNLELRTMMFQVLIVSAFTGLLSAASALVISAVSSFALTRATVGKIFAITALDVVILISVMAAVSIIAGFHFFRKGEDPNNFLIPITTAIADFGNMVILALLVILLF